MDKKDKKTASGKSFMSPEADPEGSWTGVPENPYEKPQQDADDI